jgi:hypothetical protein
MTARLRLMRAALSVLAAVVFLTAACGGGGGGLTTFDLAHQRPALTIFGARAEDGLGPIASGDVNGDGHADLIVGAPAADGPDDSRPEAGEAYVFFGPQHGETLDLSRDGADVTIFGASSGDFLSFALVAADVNGDAFADILLGAPLADGPDGQRPDAGATYVVLGGPAPAPTLDLAQDTPALTVFGAGPDDRLGSAIASGNTNGDGFADVLLGSFLADGPDDGRYQAGEAYLLLGSPSLTGERDLAQGEYDLALLAQDADDQLGHYLAMGDLDGDGRDDLIVSAFRADGPANDRDDGGEVYVFLAASELRGVVDLATARPDFTVFGAKAFDEFGGAVAAADLNGDGPTDLIVGAPRAGDESGAGQAYVFFGGPGASGSRDVAQAQQDVTLLGTDSGDRFGATVTVADLDVDGLAEVIVGAERGDGPDDRREDAGEAYVVRGSATLPATLAMAQARNAIVFGESSGDMLGTSLATADWDGDGRFGLLVGAPFVDGPGDRSDGGAAYVIHGPSLFK